ncbi:MAG: hypothetical protein RQ867_06395 [Mariprofundaceae bacterium]|nr:hypothetical protein [Mariprofundaceae bacterium]
MNSDKEAEKKPDLTESAADIEAPAAPEEGPKKYSIRLPVFLLLVILLVAGYILAPQQLKDELVNRVGALIQAEREIAFNKPEPAASPVAEPEPRMGRQETAIEIEQPETPSIIAASSDEVSRMLAAMESLQSELKSLRQEQQTIQQTQLSLQKMQLRTRLRWITNAANHLPQLQLAWEEIALMPSLSSDEHAAAQKMLALAQQRLQNLRNWQQSLQSHADSLTTPEHVNIIPEYETPWLSWIRNYFSIKAASTTEQQQDEQLRRQLLDISRNIELEQWPDGKSWQQLRATLQLRLARAAADSREAVELALPESFDPLKADIGQLRQTAATWLEDL